MDFELIDLKIEDNLAVLTLNHPEVLNAISPPMLDELKRAVVSIGMPDSGVRCLLITGKGRGFCAGANLAVRGEGAPDPKAVPFSLDDTYNSLFLRLRELNMPIVTAVNGPAAGIGMSLALMGDLVLAAESAYFLMAFRRIGLIPDGGATYLLSRAIGKARAMELALLGEKLSADTALDWGLINRVFEDDKLADEAHALARELAQGPTVSLGLIRRSIWMGMDNSYEEQMHVESVLQLQAGASQDATEGAMAFLQKRPANFQGK